MKLNGHKLHNEYISTDVKSILDSGHFAPEPWELASVYDELYERDDGDRLQEFYDSITSRWQELQGVEAVPVRQSFKGGLYYGAVFEDVIRDKADDYGGKGEVLKAMDENDLYELTTGRLRSADDDGEVARFFRQTIDDFDPESAVRKYGVDQ